MAYEKFLTITGRKIWKAVVEHELNCRFVYLGEGAVLAGRDLEVPHFKKKNIFCRVCSYKRIAQDGQEQV